MGPLAVAVSGRGVLADPVLPLNQDILFGRAARDSVRSYGGTPFRLGAKIGRLARSAASLGLPPLEGEQVEALVDQVLDRVGPRDAILRLLWTSGREPGDDPFSKPAAGEALIIAIAPPAHVERLQREGIRLAVLESGIDTELRARAPWLLPATKASGSAYAMAAWQEARRRGLDDALLVDSEGRVLEGPATNIWWRRGRALFTPGLELGILPGVVRQAIAEIAPELGFEVHAGVFRCEDVQEAEEVFVTSTVAEVVGAVELDGRPIGEGSVGEAAPELLAALRALAAAEASQAALS